MVVWTGGSYDYDDVARALVRLDRPEMDKAEKAETPYRHFTDPEVDAPTIVSGSEIWTLPNLDRPHWNEVLDALQEDVDFFDDGETTVARDGSIAIPGVYTARVCPGVRNEERYDRRGVRPGENSKGFITAAKPTERRPFFSALPGHSSLMSLEKSCGTLGAQRGTRRETAT